VGFEIFLDSSALHLSGNAQYQTNFQGLNLAVCADLPALCSGSRRFKSEVAPMYSCSGKSTLRMIDVPHGCSRERQAWMVGGPTWFRHAKPEAMVRKTVGGCVRPFVAVRAMPGNTRSPKDEFQIMAVGVQPAFAKGLRRAPRFALQAPSWLRHA
jgi:hypothetical protein